MPVIKSFFQSPISIAVTATALVVGVGWYWYKHPTKQVYWPLSKKDEVNKGYEEDKEAFDNKTKPIIPISVNYHFTRVCNAECGFCFHTETSGHHEKLPEAYAALRLLRDEGMQKLNFAGGEPFLYAKHLGKMCKFAKEELGLQSVSIVSNGTRITDGWLREWGAYVDILAVSCDSFVTSTNEKIGRKERKGGAVFDNVKKLFQIRDWCLEQGVKFKLNTVVCSLNWEEDMAETVKQLAPCRWKVFQVLVVDGENENDQRRRDARKFAITDEQFDVFCKKHQHVGGFTPEPNETMRSSYLVRFPLTIYIFSSWKLIVLDP